MYGGCRGEMPSKLIRDEMVRTETHPHYEAGYSQLMRDIKALDMKATITEGCPQEAQDCPGSVPTRQACKEALHRA